MQLSLDSFCAGPNGEMDWMTLTWDDELKQYVTALTEAMDCIVLGRKLAEGFIPYWASVAADPGNADIKAGRKFTDTHKVVFSKTLHTSQWNNNTVLAKGNLSDEINKLKNQEGKDIMAYGGATFASALMKEGLIDELHLFINPTVIVNGLAPFADKTGLELMQSKAFPCGIVLLQYKPV